MVFPEAKCDAVAPLSLVREVFLCRIERFLRRYVFTMKEFRLSFGHFYLLDNQILEAVIDDGIDVTSDNVREMKEFVRALTPPPRMLLANRKNSYSFSFGAMMSAITFNEFDAVAELSARNNFTFIGETIWPKFFKLAFFTRRDEAISWLIEKQKKECF